MKNKIKQLLADKGMTQKELASRIGMTEVGLCKALKSGTKNSTIEKIADVLEVESWTLQSDEPIKVLYEGELHIADVALPCFVLENGVRILSGRGMQSAMHMVSSDEDTSKQTAGTRLNRYLSQESLKPFIFNNKSQDHFNPIICSYQGKTIHGYEATTLIDLCNAFLDARAKIKLSPRQAIIAQQCEIIIRATAKVGIIALVDEATGYQYEREHNELQKILAAYVSEEILKWQLTFTDEFYKEVYRLWNLPYIPKYIRNKPSFIGKVTSTYIYDLMPHGVVEKIKEQTGKTDSGNWKYKWHQSLTQDVGRQHLLKQIHEVTTLMSISKTKKEFEHYFNLKYGKELELPLEFDK